MLLWSLLQMDYLQSSVGWSGKNEMLHWEDTRCYFKYFVVTARSEPGGTRWRTRGEVKGKLANGVGSQYSHATSELGLSSITQADAHTSAVSSRLSWRPHRFKWTRPFRGKTKSGFWACVITFRTRYTTQTEKCTKRTNQVWNCQSQWGLERYKTTRVTDWALNVISRRLGVWSILTSERNVKTESDKPQT